MWMFLKDIFCTCHEYIVTVIGIYNLYHQPHTGHTKLVGLLWPDLRYVRSELTANRTCGPT